MMMVEMMVVVLGDYSADVTTAYIDRNSTQNNDGSTNQRVQ